MTYEDVCKTYEKRRAFLKDIRKGLEPVLEGEELDAAVAEIEQWADGLAREWFEEDRP